jgi:hypothetical protein
MTNAIVLILRWTYWIKRMRRTKSTKRGSERSPIQHRFDMMSRLNRGRKLLRVELTSYVEMAGVRDAGQPSLRARAHA